MIGIYKIENLVNGKVYIGQSVDIKKRWCEHKYELNNNIHPNIYLQNSWNKYGKENFNYTILELCSLDNLNFKEVYWIDAYKSYDKNYGYNMTVGGDGCIAYKPVLQFDLLGNFIKKFNHASLAASETGVSLKSITSSCLFNIDKPKLYIWLYEEDYNDDNQIINKYLNYNICAYDIKLDLLGIFSSPTVVYKKLGVYPLSLYGNGNLSKDIIFIYYKDRNKIHDNEFLNSIINGKYKRKSILQIDFDGNVINRFISVSDAVKYGYHGGRIIDCCKHRILYYKTFIWVYEDDFDYINNINYAFIRNEYLKNPKTQKKIIQRDCITSMIINIWNSTEDAHKNGYIKKYVRECCNYVRESYKNCFWEYIFD